MCSLGGNLRPFVIISSSYLLFTVTDGAVRMIVLMHAYNLGFSALGVALMFSLYELAGVATNLLAGLAGDRWGLRSTLLSGLVLQLVGLGVLMGWQDDWSTSLSIVYVTLAQMLCGIAKDLTKLGGKAVTKLVTPDDKQTRLFKLVSIITGMKNSLKGVGYFLGSALLSISNDGYMFALLVMMGLVVVAIPWPLLSLSADLGRGTEASTLSQALYTGNHNLNVLSLARAFLFASRDFWFEVPLPFYLRSPSCEGLGETLCSSVANCTLGAICPLPGPDMQDNTTLGVCANLNPGGGCGGLGLDRVLVGTFLAVYIIVYGQVQSWTPQLVTSPLRQTPPNKYTEMLWGSLNVLPTAVMAGLVWQGDMFRSHDNSDMLVALISSVSVFAIIFGVNSSIHSYLVVRYAKKDKVAKSIGFYYMSNAVGRLIGTVGSGLLYTFAGEQMHEAAGTNATGGLAACFFAGSLCSVLAAVITSRIHDDTAGLMCGSCVLVPAAAPPDTGAVEVCTQVSKATASHDHTPDASNAVSSSDASKTAVSLHDHPSANAVSSSEHSSHDSQPAASASSSSPSFDDTVSELFDVNAI